MAKRIVDVPVEVDDVALSKRGWSAVEARARIATDTWSSLSVSLTLEFSMEGWRSRFKDPDLMLSPVVVEISGNNLGETSYIDSLVWRPEPAIAGQVRVSVSGTINYSDTPLKAADLTLKLTSFDAADTLVGIRPLPVVARSLDVEFEEAASNLGVMDLEVDVDAYVSRARESDEDVVVLVRGAATLASYSKLVEATAKRDAGHDTGEFELNLPDIEVDVVDDTDFLLHRFSVTHYMEVRGRSEADVPKRPAEWIDFLTVDVNDLAGEPTKAVVRLVDG
jgi:hypothetical protein